MRKVLLIDDDSGILTTTEAVLRRAGYQVSAARNGRDGIRVAKSFQPHAALVDLRLPDISGLEVLAELRAFEPSTRCLLMTGFGDLASAVEAMRLGACDYMQKPVWSEDLLGALAKAFDSDEDERAPSSEPTEVHDLMRWSETIVRFMSSPSDARNLAEFGRAVGTSTGAFRNWCRTARLSARRSLHFARALRAVRLHQREGTTRPQKFLNIVDLRTLTKFLIKSGGTGCSLPPSIDAYLQQQQHVGGEAVETIRAALRRSDKQTGLEAPRGPRSVSRR